MLGLSLVASIHLVLSADGNLYKYVVPTGLSTTPIPDDDEDDDDDDNDNDNGDDDDDDDGDDNVHPATAQQPTRQ